MITEDYVSFEVAKLLKEKGFNVETEHKMWYVVRPYSTGTQFNSITYRIGETTREYSKEHCIPMPTQQMAMKWLREVHGIFIGVKCNCNNLELTCTISKVEDDFGDKVYENVGFYFQTYFYEEAVEAALKYSLKNLI